MTLTLLTGTANPALAGAVAAALGVTLGQCEVLCFPDGELQVDVREPVRGRDVYLIQPTAPPVERHLLELLLLGDACHRAGAARVSAVLPYFGYARQDRRTSAGQAAGARVIADLIETRRFARLVALDLHSPALEGFFATPVEHLTAVPVLAAALEGARPDNGVVVAPDLGAAKLAARYGKALRLPVAIVHKVRHSGTEVEARSVTGEVRRRTAIIVDDMISTGGTIAAAAAALAAAGCEPELTVVATHALLVGPAVDRLRTLPLRRLIVTDSVILPKSPALPMEVTSVAPLLGDAILRLHHDRSLGALLSHD
jgi:ribose-phosphate pyrophosphokinase